MMMLRMEAVQTNRYLIVLWLVEVTSTRLWRSNMVVADGIVRTHTKHLEDILWVDLGLLRERLMGEHALQIFLKRITLKVACDVLVTMTCVSLI